MLRLTVHLLNSRTHEEHTTTLRVAHYDEVPRAVRRLLRARGATEEQLEDWRVVSTVARRLAP